MSNHNYLLEVKEDSMLHKALDHFNGKPWDMEHAKTELGEVPSAVASKFLIWYARYFTNFGVNKSKGNLVWYDAPLTVHVQANVTAPMAITTTSADVPGEENIPTDNMRWPQQPPVPRSLKAKFDKPSYFSVMEMMVDANRHIALEGPPGVGKDTAVVELAAQQRKPLVTIGGDAGFRTSDLTGKTHISNGHSYHEVGDYVAAVVNGWWVLMTEVNAADPSALMFINRQLAAPYVVNLGGKSYPVHPDFRLFVTYNNGLVGTKPLPQSFKDRFFSIKVPFFSEVALRKRLISMGMPVVVNDPHNYSERIVTFGVRMWDAHMRGALKYQITTRRLIDAVHLAFNCGMNVKQALKDAVISAIDNSLEAKHAETVLDDVMRMMF